MVQGGTWRRRPPAGFAPRARRSLRAGEGGVTRNGASFRTEVLARLDHSERCPYSLNTGVQVHAAIALQAAWVRAAAQAGSGPLQSAARTVCEQSPYWGRNVMPPVSPTSVAVEFFTQSSVEPPKFDA